MNQDHITKELARVFNTSGKAMRLMDRANLPQDRLPAWGAEAPIDFWNKVAKELERGLTHGGLMDLVYAAAIEYPGNRVFRENVAKYGTATSLPFDRATTKSRDARGIEQAIEELKSAPEEPVVAEIEGLIVELRYRGQPTSS